MADLQYTVPKRRAPIFLI